MILDNIRDYVKVYDNFLDKAFCKKIINNINKNSWDIHAFYAYADNKTISYDNELSVSYDRSLLKTELQNKIWFAIEQYILKDFNFSWWDSWNGYSEVRFNKYSVNTKMHQHCDHIHSMFDGQRKGIPTLSIVGSLNNNYKGGEFIMWETEKIKIPEGSILIFPSNFMYPHKVNPVTKGTRYSYVSWVY